MLQHSTMRTKIVQRKELMVLSQDIRAIALCLSPCQSQTASCPEQMRVTETLFTLLHDTYCASIPPCPLTGAPHTYFPRCVPLADGAQLDAQSPHSVQVLGALQTTTRMETRGFPWCALHSPSAKKMSTAKEVRDST